ncbi:MAG: hypothetical protein ACRCTR_03075 [Actinomycetota bacterium]
MRLGVFEIGSSGGRLFLVETDLDVPPNTAAIYQGVLPVLADSVDDAWLNAAVMLVQQAVTAAREHGCLRLVAYADTAVHVDGLPGALEKIQQATGVRIHVVSSLDEARFSFHAVRQWFGWSAGSLVVVDVGAATVRIARGVGLWPEALTAVDVGAGRSLIGPGAGDETSVRAHDPLAWIGSLRHAAQEALSPAVTSLLPVTPETKAVGAGSLLQSLAGIAAAYDAAPPGWRSSSWDERPASVGRLGLVEVATWIPELAGMSALEREILPGVIPGHGAPLLAAAVLVEAAMKLLQVDALPLSPWGLGEGIARWHMAGVAQSSARSS